MSAASIKYIAHRGYSSAYFENTVEAMHRAMDLSNVSFVETDVRLNKDSDWVVFHDTTLIGSDGQTYTVKELTTKECQELEIHLFSDFLRDLYTHPRSKEVALFLDIKGSAESYDLRKLVNCHWKYPGPIYCASFNPFIVRDLILLRAYMLADFKVGFIGHYECIRYCLDFIVTDVDLINRNYVTAVIEKLKCKLFVYTVNDKRTAQHLTDLGIHGIITDDPLIFLQSS